MTYRYHHKKYRYDVLFIGYYLVAIAVISAVLMVLNVLRPIMMVVFLVSLYGVWSTFLAKQNISALRIEPSRIFITTMGEEQEFRLSEIAMFRVKQFSMDGKLYLRLKANGEMHRFWLNLPCFNEKERLWKELVSFIYQVHPDSNYAKQYLKQPAEK